MGNSYRSALITGSTSGIGTAFTEALPAQTSLLLTGRNSTALAKLSEGLASSGRRVDVVTADLAVSAGRDAVIEAARRASIDLLICSAGLGFSGQFPTTSIEADRQTAEVNIVATIELLHALIPSMLAAARSHSHRAGIIVVSSSSRVRPMPEPRYLRSKQSLSVALGRIDCRRAEKRARGYSRYLPNLYQNRLLLAGWRGTAAVLGGIARNGRARGYGQLGKKERLRVLRSRGVAKSYNKNTSFCASRRETDTPKGYGFSLMCAPSRAFQLI